MTSTEESLSVLPSKSSASKRKRSPSVERPSSVAAPAAKAAKTHGTAAQINYLFRHFTDVLPMISLDETLPNLLQLLADYGGVLERHESLAGNLGARPLGPILIKRFERLFEGPPRVLKSHGKEGTTVTWLDVVEFARHKPEQFNLEKMRDGLRVCQIYTKQSRVEISEEDFMLISSGMPQKLIPPQPIAEDEEKELGTLEIMESMIAQVAILADQGAWAKGRNAAEEMGRLERIDDELTSFAIVATRSRQMNHRLKHRRHAIIARREIEAASDASQFKDPAADHSLLSNGDAPRPESPKSGFVAVNRASALKESNGIAASDTTKAPSTMVLPSHTFTGTSALPSTRNELLSLFHPPRAAEIATPEHMPTPPTRPIQAHSKSKAKAHIDPSDVLPSSLLDTSASPGPAPHTPSNHGKSTGGGSSAAERLYDDAGPYKAEMLSRMDRMGRGDRVRPPCDRCRRLHMDCLKNLTACLGCTKKHAKCSWKDVSEQELLDHPFPPAASADDELAAAAGAGDESGVDGLTNGGDAKHGASGAGSGGPGATSLEVRDEELLGEELSDDAREATPLPVNGIAQHEKVAVSGAVVAEAAASPALAKASAQSGAGGASAGPAASTAAAVASGPTIATGPAIIPKAIDAEPMDLDGEDVDHILATAAGGQEHEDEGEEEEEEAEEEAARGGETAFAGKQQVGGQVEGTKVKGEMTGEKQVERGIGGSAGGVVGVVAGVADLVKRELEAGGAAKQAAKAS